MGMMRHQVRTLLLLLMPLMFTGGCATRAVWQAEFDDWNEPYANANLRLYDARPRHDFLVVYDEHSGRHETIRTRAYYLDQSQPRILARHAPEFVKPSKASSYPPVPVYDQPGMRPNPPALLYAVRGTNALDFAIYSWETSALPRKLGDYELPIYNDGVGKYERAALTPPAVVADVAIVGGIVFWYYRAGGVSE
jgi:hypothetical protein